MARLKAFLPRLTSGSAIVLLISINPSKEYVNPFSQEINVTHNERCYYKADQSV